MYHQDFSAFYDIIRKLNFKDKKAIDLRNDLLGKLQNTYSQQITQRIRMQSMETIHSVHRRSDKTIKIKLKHPSLHSNKPNSEIVPQLIFKNTKITQVLKTKSVPQFIIRKQQTSNQMKQ